MKQPGLATASIRWHDELPASDHYKDIYFSRENGQEESLHVFIKGNDLIERFKNLAPTEHFLIAETGFGSGLNFLVAWDIWETYAPKKSTLSFHSVEKSPLNKTDLVRSHRLWPNLRQKAQALHEQYPSPVRGSHRCVFADTRIRLSLFYGEAADWLKTCSFQAHAWFLDGFSPRKNPELWTPEIFQGIRHHSRSATTVSTYSAARSIREGLSGQSFAVEKTPGFGAKRDMIKGKRLLPPTGNSDELTNANNRCSFAKVLVVGSGLAGAFTARNLANRGYKVAVLESAKQIAAGASGNQQGALYIKLAVNWSPHTRYHLASYLFALRAYAQVLGSESDLWKPTGVLQLAQTPREAIRQGKFLQNANYPDSVVTPVDQQTACKLSGVDLKSGGLFFPGGGWCRPARICRVLLNHPLISISTESMVISQHIVDEDTIRLITAQGTSHQANHVVYCTGNTPDLNATTLPFLDTLPLKRIRGQTTQASVPESLKYPLKTVICGEGYAMPAFEEYGSRQLLTGASFHPRRDDALPEAEDNLDNLNKLGAISADFCELTKSLHNHQQQLTGRASVRAALPDYFPAVGQSQSGTFINLGYGSKGLALAPLAGEIIADLIGGHPPPIEADLLERLSPDRFKDR